MRRAARQLIRKRGPGRPLGSPNRPLADRAAELEEEARQLRAGHDVHRRRVPRSRRPERAAVLEAQAAELRARLKAANGAAV